MLPGHLATGPSVRRTPGLITRRSPLVRQFSGAIKTKTFVQHRHEPSRTTGALVHFESLPPRSRFGANPGPGPDHLESKRF